MARVEQTTTLVARVAGLVLLLVGVWGAIQVVGEAWQLYRSPDTVSRFAEAVERGTHIDRILLPANRRAQPDGQGNHAASSDQFRPSHILGWVLAIALLLLVGRLCFWILLAGAKLTYGPAQDRSGSG